MFTCWGTIGQVGLVPEDGPYPEYIISNKQLKLRVDRSIADPRFCFYYFASPRYAEHIKNRGIGGAVPGINLGILKSLPIALPPIDVQQQIADMLSAYDDLIENNRRRMALLEEAARQLYREWFVRLRFPGHEHTRITNGVPEGWAKVSIGAAFQTVLGGTPSRARSEFWDGGTVPWINSGKVNELRIIEPSELITEEALKNSAAKLMPRGTTVLAITGATLGQVSVLEIECAANQSVVGIVDPSGLRSEFVYLTMSHCIGELVARATGGAQVHINKDIGTRLAPRDAVRCRSAVRDMLS